MVHQIQTTLRKNIMTLFDDYLKFSKIQSEARVARVGIAIKRLAENQVKRASINKVS